MWNAKAVVVDKYARKVLDMMASMYWLFFFAKISSRMAAFNPACCIIRQATMSLFHQLKSASNKQITCNLLT